MRRDGKNHQAWRRRDGNPDNDPGHVFRELQRRELRDLETCRRVWEAEQDPLAVCEALRQAQLPEWLESAALAMLTDETFCPSLRRRLWRDRTRHATDGERASQVAMVRSTPGNREFTWEWSYKIADRLSRERYGDLPPVTDAALKRCYQRVCAGLRHPHRYYRACPGMADRIGRAWDYMLGLMKARLTEMRERESRD